ncbi:glycosyltransferase family 4 protein [Nitratireductor aquimarinus]|uniref:glycosyltransferase family 4 protein n=1 Tax=Alphaproteobacteria TaxID=28211 RepID=UPI0019D3D690|nr:MULTISPECIES: glycosyltransferase family 4 protein [Alphaproteobacteria]MBN7755748.1 glycosyltransferase family 4 protein [Nitratireductor aquimarinus]MBY5998502.1 glycosyltransferase family 4 protein [Tritonibacter mobilis]MBY6020534.1 glycosyltransferase family 4 protein [Nitratireductor sp. DP7N14-4]
MRPGRVVIINDRSAEIGGASNLSCLSARLLREAGVPVTFFAGDSPAQAGQPDAVHLGDRPLVERGRIAAFAGGLYNRNAHAALRGWIEAHDRPSTIYHVHGWSKILSPSIFRALMPVRGRVVLHAHDYFLACPNGGFINYPMASVCKLAPMSLRCLTTQCDKRGFHQKAWRSARHMMMQRFFALHSQPANIVLVHEAMRDYFARSGIDDSLMVTIRNPVEPFLRSGARPQAMRDFFFVGRLEPEKGFEDAAQAARLAGVPFHVIGEGAGRTVLENRYPEVTLHGWCNRARIAELMRTARCVVISSRVPEPFGLAALEAVGSGIPVVLPGHALLGRELTQAGAAFTFPTGGIEALAATLRRLADDDGLVAAMSDDALAVAPLIANTAQTWLSALLALYGSVLERASAEHGRRILRATRAKAAATETGRSLHRTSLER